ncbi:MAG: hypothetical protein LUH02_08255 [Erysipelotrichaceae bacterium]|nr:hypothetical protein [Erysipelotrichaceae bacterium]
MPRTTKVNCKNVFKNNDKESIKAAYNLKWIELINLYEKVKCTISRMT